MNRTTIIIGIVAVWIFLPPFLMLMNVSGFNQLNNDIVQQVNADDFNLLSLTGFGTFFNYLFQLASFSVSGLGAFANIFILFLSLVSFIVVILLIRGGGS